MDRGRHRVGRAFSLVELVLVIAILGVLALIVIPKYGNSLAIYHAQAAAARIAADLNFARTRARTCSLGQSVAFSVAGNNYVLAGIAGLNGSGTYQVTLSAEPYVATLVSTTFASATVSFDRYGQPAAGGTVVVQSGTVSKTIAVDAATGLASVQ